MKTKYLIVDDDELATVRITKAVLDNFKSVSHGEVVFDCGRHDVPADTRSDMLGLYGQNGSGKTSFIEALRILKCLASGRKVPDEYAECVAVGAEFARLGFEFDLQYLDGRRMKVGYSACLKAERKPDERDEDELDLGDIDLSDQYCVRVFDEVVRMGGMANGRRRQYRPCIDTTEASPKPFGPESKAREFFDCTTSAREELLVNRTVARERSCSFIFMADTMKVFFQDGKNRSEYYRALAELRYFARRYLYVIDSRLPSASGSAILLPIYSIYGMIPIPAAGTAVLPRDVLDEVLFPLFESLNIVLPELVPGLSIGIRTHGATMMRSGDEGVSVTFVSMRESKEFPLRAEAEGIRRLISVLSLIVFAFNSKSATVAIDELDAGVFEYLLGELLRIFEESGSGQLIFTSHNLRPLEVLNKDAIWFTTTNPENRYYHMKYLGATNNLRSVYFREILVDEQEEELYRVSKKYKIISALRKANPDLGGE